MKIAVPVTANKLSMHFGHCEKFAFYEVDPDEKVIKKIDMITPPQHEPGNLPPWVKQQGADIVITGGMGSRAQSLFTAAGVKVLTGAVSDDPKDVITEYLNNELQIGQNSCDH